MFIKPPKPPLEFVPPGHFYSPLPSLDIAKSVWLKLGEPVRSELPGFDAQLESQLEFLQRFPAKFPYLPWPAEKTPEFRYYYKNRYFYSQDAAVLSAIFAHYRPKKVVEVGSGFSSAAMMDLADSGMCQPEFTFIEPFPERLLQLVRDENAVNLISEPVSEVDVSTFGKLDENDILFIDSSHVIKTASDLHFIMFNILPMIRRGVIVHFHDIFWPFEYPEGWYREGRAWNETYFIRLLLTFSTQFQIISFNSYLNCRVPEMMQARLPDKTSLQGPAPWVPAPSPMGTPIDETPFNGSGLWLMKRG